MRFARDLSSARGSGRTVRTPVGASRLPKGSAAQGTVQPMRERAISAVVPLHNEEGNVEPLLDELTRELAALSDSYEVIMVDDGSTDETLERMRAYMRRRPDVPVRVVELRRQFGQTAAIATGLRRALGDTIVTLDGDMQNDPADIPALLRCLDDGADVACGWRVRREEGPVRHIPSRVAASVVGLLTGLRVRDSGCTLRAYRREIVRDLDLWGDMHRFIPALCHAVGARVAEVPVKHRPRLRGRTKYGRTGLGRLYRVALDLITLSILTRHRTRPISFFGWWATGALLAAVATAAAVAWFGAATATVIGLVALLVAAAFVFLCIGAQSELAARTYLGLSSRGPAYVRSELRSEGWEEAFRGAEGVRPG